MSSGPSLRNLTPSPPPPRIEKNPNPPPKFDRFTCKVIALTEKKLGSLYKGSGKESEDEKKGFDAEVACKHLGEGEKLNTAKFTHIFRIVSGETDKVYKITSVKPVEGMGALSFVLGFFDPIRGAIQFHVTQLEKKKPDAPPSSSSAKPKATSSKLQGGVVEPADAKNQAGQSLAAPLGDGLSPQQRRELLGSRPVETDQDSAWEHMQSNPSGDKPAGHMAVPIDDSTLKRRQRPTGPEVTASEPVSESAPDQALPALDLKAIRENEKIDLSFVEGNHEEMTQHCQDQLLKFLIYTVPELVLPDAVKSDPGKYPKHNPIKAAETLGSTDFKKWPNTDHQWALRLNKKHRLTFLWIKDELSKFTTAGHSKSKK